MININLEKSLSLAEKERYVGVCFELGGTYVYYFNYVYIYIFCITRPPQILKYFK